jgi:cytochrome P450
VGEGVSSATMTAIEHDAPVDYPSSLTHEELFQPSSDMLGLSRQQPVWRLNYADGTVGWLVFDFPRGRVVLNDPRFSVLPAGFAADDGGFGKATEELRNPGDLLRLDPPQHTRVRKALTAFFTVHAIGELRPAIAKTVANCIDAMEEHGKPADFIEMFARDLPGKAICTLVGVPQTDVWRFDTPMRVLGAFDGTTLEQKQAALDEFYAYVREVIAQKRAQPDESVISQLLARGELTDDELAGVTWFLFAAGQDTTAATLGSTVYFLLYEPGRWQAVQAYPIERLVEELFRYVQVFRTGFPQRTALEDVDLDGYLIKAGEHVTVYQGTINRDPERFPEPDQFEPERDAAGHWLFGFGRHMCLGQHLARLEVQVGLAALIERFPDLQLAIPRDEVPIVREGFMHGIVTELPVEW